MVSIWGVTFISTKVLIGAGLAPDQIFAIRFLQAYAGIWLLGAFSLKNPVHGHFRIWADSLKDESVFVLLGITGGSVYFLAENTALAYTQACNVSFLVCTAPLVTLLLTLAVRRRIPGLEDVRTGWRLWGGTCLALAGVAAVTLSGQKMHLSVKGDVLALAASFCWAVYSIFMAQMTRKYGALTATRKVFFYGLLTIVPLLISDNSFNDSRRILALMAQPSVWLNLLFLGLIASLFCFALWNKVMAELGNVSSTNYVYLNPFFTLMAAVIVLGERLTTLSAIGSLAIVAGVFIASRKKS